MKAIMFAVCLALTAAACASEKSGEIQSQNGTAAAAIIQIRPPEMRDVIGDLGDNKAQFIDVRTPQEFSAGHAKNAVNMPLDDLEKTLSGLDAEKPTYDICQTGRRSQTAAELLQQSGFTKIYNVGGGTAALHESGRPMHSPMNATAQKRAGCLGYAAICAAILFMKAPQAWGQCGLAPDAHRPAAVEFTLKTF